MRLTFFFYWLRYHILTLFRSTYHFQPFGKNILSVPIKFRPGGTVGVFVFSLLSLILIFLPILYFIIFLLDGRFQPLLIVISIAGLIFSMFIRKIYSDFSNYLVFDGDFLCYVKYGYLRKTKEKMPCRYLKGLALIKMNAGAAKNFKICIVTKYGWVFMLRFLLIKKKADKYLQNLAKAMNLPIIELDTNEIKNDYQFRWIPSLKSSTKIKSTFK